MFRRMLSVEDMLKYEQWIEEEEGKDITSFDNYSKLADELNLKVKYLSDNEMSKNTEAELSPIDENTGFLGLITIKDAYKETKFAYMHEIIHYLYDVGKGKRVKEKFTRMVKGKTKDKHEQDINYITAAATMKMADIKKAIQKYDEQKPFVDELNFINELSKRYNQSPDAVIRRIQEVRRLSKVKK